MPGLEDLEQIKFFQWIDLASIRDPRLALTFHIANQRKCSPHYGKLLKAMGVKSGVPDIFVPVPAGDYHGCFIELKAGSGKVSKEQQQFLAKAILQGYFAFVAWSADEAIKELKGYLSGEKLGSVEALPNSHTPKPREN